MRKAMADGRERRHWRGLACIWLALGFGWTLLPAGFGNGAAADTEMLRMGLYLLLAWGNLSMAAVSVRTARGGEKTEKDGKLGTQLCFAAYLILLLRVTLFDAAMGREVRFWFTAPAAARTAYLADCVNRIPFRTIRLYLAARRAGTLTRETIAWNLAGNLIIFVPFRWFCGRLCAPLRRFLPGLAVTAGAVLTVEGVQLLLLCGRVDVDDILLNSAGAALCTPLSAVGRKLFWQRMAAFLRSKNGFFGIGKTVSGQRMASWSKKAKSSAEMTEKAAAQTDKS